MQARFLLPLLLGILSLTISGCGFDLSLTDLESVKKEIQQDVEITIDSDLPIANSGTVNSFPISGTCTSSVKTFNITSPLPAQSVTCTDGTWSAVVDISAAADGVVDIVTDVTMTGSFLPVSFQINKDTAPPTVTGIVLESGATLTNKSTLSYAATGTDIAQVYLTEDSTCAAGGTWKSTGSGTVSVSAGDGLKSFYAKTKDTLDNTSVCTLVDTITVDRTPPVITGLSDDAVLRASKSWAWSCTDAHSPCEYRHQITAAVAVAPVGIYSISENASYSGTGTYHISVQAKDAAGNESAPVSVQAVLDSTLPDLAIEGGAAYHTSNSVTLSLLNLGTYDEIDLSNSAACAGATTVPVAGTLPWSLTAGDGLKSVYFIYRDTVNATATTCTNVDIVIDTSIPSVVLTTAAANVFTAPNFMVTATFSENVLGFDATKVTATNATVSGVSGSGSVYTFMITPSGQGAITVQIPSSQVFDRALNMNTASNTLNKTYDSVKPTVLLSTASSNPFSTSTISVDATFSESVTGFVLADISVSNGVASAFSGSGTTYTFTITPNGQGPVSVSIAAGVAQDTAGNTNTVSPAFTRNYDNVAPTITGLSNDATWRTSKTWTWGCSETCTSRFVVDTNAVTAPSGAFGSTLTTSQMSGTGTYYLHLEVQDGAGNSSVSHFSAKLDNTLPTTPTSITDGTALNSLTTSPAIAFTSGTDAHSGIAKHQARVMKTSDNSQVATWADFVSGNAISGLSLTTNTSYYVEVRALDAVGNVSSAGVSDGWIADTTAPFISTMVTVGNASLTESPTISWSAASDGAGGSGINHYEVRIVATPSGTLMSNWATMTSGNKVTSLSLTDGATYYAAMRTIDNAGNTSAVMAMTATWTAVDYDPCADAPTPGMTCSGGAVYVGKADPYGATSTTTGPGDHYMTTPGGCSEVPSGANKAYTQSSSDLYSYSTVDFTPTCSGSTDSVTKALNNAMQSTGVTGLTFAPGTVGTTYSSTNRDAQYGSAKTALLVQANPSNQGGKSAAALYCEKMVYGGHSDWYLPNIYELHLLYVNRASLNGLGSADYWSSSPAYVYSYLFMRENMGTGNQGNDTGGYPMKIRCVRKFQVPSEIEPPTNPQLPAKNMYISLTDTPVLTWTASPYGGTSGIDHYEVRIFRVSDNVAASAWTTLASGGQLTGLTLDDGEKYYFKVRMVTVDASLSAEVTSAKSWQAYAVDPCSGNPAAGTECADGSFSIGSFAGYNYKTTPGNCVGSPASPTCNNAVDTLKNYWGTYGTKTSIISTTDGAANTTALVTTYGALTLPFSPDGAKFCENLVFGGHSDWFLPAQEELNLFWWNLSSSERTSMGVAPSGYYQSSTEYNHATQGKNNVMVHRFDDGLQNSEGKSAPQYTRCVRKEVGACAGTPADTQCAGSEWTGGAIYVGSLRWGTSSVTSGPANHYMTTPGGCGEIPGGQIVATTLSPKSDYPNGDFTPVCSGTDTLTRTWSNGLMGYNVDIAALTNYTANTGTGYGAKNIDNQFGSGNTATIAAIVDPLEGGYHAAARYCDKLVVGGFSDWYLPSRYELNLLAMNRTSIPGVAVGAYYWSSTEYDSGTVWVQVLSTGYQYNYAKTSDYRTRCVRRF